MDKTEQELAAIRERVMRCERLTALETQRLLSLAEAGRQQTAIQLLREAQEELRLIRMKDTNAVYDPTLRIRMSLFLDNPAPPSAPVLPEPTKEVPKQSANELRMNAYYYAFTPTGILPIDKILSAVASAGKAYHHTDCWLEDCDGESYGHRGNSPAEWVQRAAEDAAALWPDAVLPEGQPQKGRK